MWNPPVKLGPCRDGQRAGVETPGELHQVIGVDVGAGGHVVGCERATRSKGRRRRDCVGQKKSSKNIR